MAAVVKALLALVLLALVMGCSAAPPAKCDPIWELTETDLDHAADESKFPGDIIIGKTSSRSQKFVRGNIQLYFQDDRTTRPVDTFLQGKVVSSVLIRFRDACCDKSNHKCQRGTFEIIHKLTMVLQHVEGPSCTTKLDVERAQAEMEDLVQSCSRMIGHGGFNARVAVPEDGLATEAGRKVVQVTGKLQLTIASVVGRPHFNAEKVCSCAQNMFHFCCSDPHNCRMGFCMSRDPTVERTLGKVEISINPTATVLGKRPKPG
ncbi:unnamed protein product [Calypogeia fissa]